MKKNNLKPQKRVAAPTAKVPVKTPKSGKTKITSGGSGPEVVGIGASAGGIEALKKFFAAMPLESGLAFVVVMHMDPSHKSILSEIIQQTTKYKVIVANQGVEIEPNFVYTIPSDKYISIRKNKIYLSPRSPRQGIEFPIDFFFRSLALQKKDKGIAIILSGNGSDGTSGLKAIKDQLGLVMVEDVFSAQFNSMPLSALSTGLVDYTAAVEDLPAKLMAFIRHRRQATEAEGNDEEMIEHGILQKLMALLKTRTGHDFSCYKPNTLNRRILRRMNVLQIPRIELYLNYLQKHAQEAEMLFKELLTGVTNFFRDPEAFEALKSAISLNLLNQYDDRDIQASGGIERNLRVWVPACSTGEEAYSVAIILKECLEESSFSAPVKIQIFATDIDKMAIDKARLGAFPQSIAADVSAERLKRFFKTENGGYRVKSEIRDLIAFAPHNLISDPPFTKLDLICCRNLLIYFSRELQNKVLPLFRYVLNPGGLLFLGPSESLGTFSDLFTSISSKWHIFATNRAAQFSSNLISSSSSVSAAAKLNLPKAQSAHNNKIAVPDLAMRVLLDQFAPSAVLINERGDIIYLNGRTGKFLEPAPGNATMNIFAMARQGLRFELGSLIHRAVKHNHEISAAGIRVKTNGHFETITLSVVPLNEPVILKGLLLVVFKETPEIKKATPKQTLKSGSISENATIAKLKKELESSRQQIASVIQEHDISQHELLASNEELHAMNEEAQSANEELTTSREELQSLNEELMTVNAELQNKVEELSLSNDDMRNLLNSIEIPTIFLDQHLNVRRYTSQACEIFNLIPGDIGRSLTHLVSNLKYNHLSDDVKQVITTSTPRTIEVESKNGAYFMMRIIPYRTSKEIIEGVVITFSEISDIKEKDRSLAERDSLQKSLLFAQSIITTVHEPLAVLDDRFYLISASQTFYEFFQLNQGQCDNHYFFNINNDAFNRPGLEEALVKVLSERSEIKNFQIEYDPTRAKLFLNARELEGDGLAGRFILLTFKERSD